MKDFIKNNHLSFGEGQRNSTITVLVGYSQHLGISMSDLKSELTTEISKDTFISKEIERLWKYCEGKKYKKYWKTKEAKLQYKF